MGLTTKVSEKLRRRSNSAVPDNGDPKMPANLQNIKQSFDLNVDSPTHERDAAVRMESKGNQSFKGAIKAFINIESQEQKANRRNEVLREYFKLPEWESLQEEFNCALLKKVLLQGHLYIFLRHVCFYSSIFGVQKVKVIPFRDISLTQKKKNYGIPNSIEIHWFDRNPATNLRTAKREFFTSFLYRDEAFRLLEIGWFKASPYPRLVMGVPPTQAEISRLETKVGVLAKVKKPRVSSHRSSLRSSQQSLQLNVRSGMVVAQRPSLDTNSGRILDKGQILANYGKLTAAATRPTQEGSPLHQNHNKRDAFIENSTLQQWPPRRLASTSSSEDQQSVTSTHRDHDSVRSHPHPFGLNFFVLPSTPPPVTKEYTLLNETTLKGNVRSLFNAMFVDAGFIRTLHQKRGDQDVNTSPWIRSEDRHTREFSFVAHVQSSMLGRISVQCVQTQSVAVYNSVRGHGNHVVFATRQENRGAPMGSNFVVMVRWDFEDSPNPDDQTVHMKHYVWVPVTRAFAMASIVKRSVNEQSNDYFKGLVSQVQEAMDEDIVVALNDLSMRGRLQSSAAQSGAYHAARGELGYSGISPPLSGSFASNREVGSNRGISGGAKQTVSGEASGRVVASVASGQNPLTGTTSSPYCPQVSQAGLFSRVWSKTVSALLRGGIDEVRGVGGLQASSSDAVNYGRSAHGVFQEAANQSGGFHSNANALGAASTPQENHSNRHYASYKKQWHSMQFSAQSGMPFLGRLLLCALVALIFSSPTLIVISLGQQFSTSKPGAYQPLQQGLNGAFNNQRLFPDQSCNNVDLSKPGVLDNGAMQLNMQMQQTLAQLIELQNKVMATQASFKQ